MMLPETTTTGQSFLSLLLVLVLSLGMFGMVACGGDDDDDEATVTESTQPATTMTSADTEAPTSKVAPTGEPVKIGVLSCWTGPAALAGLLCDQVIGVVEYQLEERGGILGGREVEFITEDGEGQVSAATSVFQKLALDEDVTAVLLGGCLGVDNSANIDSAEEFEIPYFTQAIDPANIGGYQYTLRAGSYSSGTVVEVALDFLLNTLDPAPERVAILCDDNQNMRQHAGEWKDELEAAGVEIVYEEYVPQGTLDYSPYLTKIKYEEPDTLIGYHGAEQQYMATFKQIMELGGWDDIRYVAPSPASGPSALKMAGGEGTYNWMFWTPGAPYSASQKFEQDFEAITGGPPNPNHMFFYLCFEAAIEAIELAGSTDREDVTDVMRSGELQYDSPAGPVHFGSDGENGIKGQIYLIEDGKAVPVDS